MIKGLYFKLNIDKSLDKEIFDFFNDNKQSNTNKIDKLYELIQIYKKYIKQLTEDR